VLRALGEDEIRWKLQGTRTYQALTARCLDSLVEVQALAAPEPQRPALAVSAHQPLHAAKRE